jgi:hypothetical protein
MGKLSGDRFIEVEVRSVDELRSWLAEHHSQTEGVWLITYKKHVLSKYLMHEDLLDELVAFSWCDGRRMRVDDDRVMQQISPRRTQPGPEPTRTEPNASSPKDACTAADLPPSRAPRPRECGTP